MENTIIAPTPIVMVIMNLNNVTRYGMNYTALYMHNITGIYAMMATLLYC